MPSSDPRSGKQNDLWPCLIEKIIDVFDGSQRDSRCPRVGGQETSLYDSHFHNKKWPVKSRGNVTATTHCELNGKPNLEDLKMLNPRNIIWLFRGWINISRNS